ncbi:MAG: hypothetical protein OXE86_15545 [Alphaproteobacteria bacterium]|nr:hypothetical protein [Alphaproteobacteria bacterium]
MHTLPFSIGAVSIAGGGKNRHWRRHGIPGKCADRCAAKPATATRAASIVTVVQPARTARTNVSGETTMRRVSL